MGAAGSVVAEGIRAASPQKRLRAAAGDAVQPQDALRSSVSSIGQLRAALANWHNPAPEIELRRGTYTLRTAAAIEADSAVAEGALVLPFACAIDRCPLNQLLFIAHTRARAAAEAQEAEAAAAAAEKASQLELVAANMAAMESAKTARELESAWPPCIIRLVRPRPKPDQKALCHKSSSLNLVA